MYVVMAATNRLPIAGGPTETGNLEPLINEKTPSPEQISDEGVFIFRTGKPRLLRGGVLGILNFRANVLRQRFQILHPFANAGARCLVIFFVKFFEVTFQRHNQILYFIEACHSNMYGFKGEKMPKFR